MLINKIRKLLIDHPIISLLTMIGGLLGGVAAGLSISDRESDRDNTAWMLISQATQVSQSEKIFEIIKEISGKDFSDPYKRWYSDNEVQANIGLTSALETLNSDCKSLENVILSNTNLKKLNLSRFVVFNPMNWLKCSHEESLFIFRVADLTEADLRFVTLRKANLSHAILNYADLRDTSATAVNFSYAILDDANLHKADLRGSNLTGANMQETILMEANLSDINFKDANIIGASLQRASITQSDFSNADLTDSNLSKSNGFQANFTNAIFDGVDVTGMDFSEADISYAKMENILGLTNEQIAKACFKKGKTPYLPKNIKLPATCKNY